MSKLARMLLVAGLLLGAFCFLGADDAQAGWYGHGYGYGYGGCHTALYNYAPAYYAPTYIAPTYHVPLYYNYGYRYRCGW